MELSVNYENFRNALKKVMFAVPPKFPMPVFENVLLTAGDCRLKLCATDQEVSITACCGARVEVAGAFSVKATTLNQVLSNLPGVDNKTKLELSLIDEGQTLKITCGFSVVNLPGIQAEDFPAIPTIMVAEDQKPFLCLPSDMLLEALSQVTFAAATTDIRPVLQSVCLRGAISLNEAGEEEAASLTLAATDGFRLSVRNLQIPLENIDRDLFEQTDREEPEPCGEDEESDEESDEEPGEEPEPCGEDDDEVIPVPDKTDAALAVVPVPDKEVVFLIAAKACYLLGKAFKAVEGDIRIYVKPNPGYGLSLIEFVAEGVRMTGALVDGLFPDLKRFIPAEYTTRALLETSELVNALKLILVFTDKLYTIVKLEVVPGDDVSPGKFTLSAGKAGSQQGSLWSNGELGNSAHEVCGIVHGEGLKIAVNSKYLLEGLGAIGTAKTALEFLTPQNAVVIKGVGSSNFLYLTMPVTIKE